MAEAPTQGEECRARRGGGDVSLRPNGLTLWCGRQARRLTSQAGLRILPRTGKRPGGDVHLWRWDAGRAGGMAESEGKTAPMTTSEAGRKGGSAVREKYGKDYYRPIGRDRGSGAQEKQGRRDDSSD